MGWPKGVPRKPREIVEQDNSTITKPVAPDGMTFKEKDDEGGMIQNAPQSQPFNLRQRQNMEARFEKEVLGIEPEPPKPKVEEPVIETKPTETEPAKVEEEPLRPTVPVKPVEEPVKPVVAKPQEETPPASPPPATAVTESEEYKASVKRMHEATQEAAELRRLNKQLSDMITQFKSPPVPQAPQPQPEPQLTSEQKLEMLQADPVGYMEKIEQEAIRKAEERIFGKLEERTKVTAQQQQMNNFVTALDKRFREKHPDLNDPLYEPYIERASQQLALTQDGAVLLISKPDEFLDSVANSVRPTIESLKARFNPAPQATTPGQPNPNETRERIPASPVVKPSSSQAVPAGPKEEKEETPQDYVNGRRQFQKKVFGQVSV